MTKAYSFFIFLLCMLLAHAESNKHQATGVTLELVSELSTIAPDESFTLGLKLDLDDDFHTYWKTPVSSVYPYRLTGPFLMALPQEKSNGLFPSESKCQFIPHTDSSEM